jgi:formate dehydrogenase major subunit
VLEKGKQVDTFGSCAMTARPPVAAGSIAGCWTERGNMMARRDTSDPGNTGAYANWAFSWPANRRILYNRASADIDGKAWDPKRKLIEWNGTSWTGYDVPDIAPECQAAGCRPVHHEP